MNKKFLVIVLVPALLLGGCISKNSISKEQAAEVANKIAQRQAESSLFKDNIGAFSIKTESRNTVTSKTNYEKISTYTSSHYKVNAFEYVAESNFLYLFSRNANHDSATVTTQNWAFVLDGYFYFLQEATKKEGYKFKVPDGKDLFGCLSLLFGETINLGYFFKNTELSTFDTALNTIKDGKDLKSEWEDEETSLPTITNFTEYYSVNNDNQLRVEHTSKLNALQYSYMDLEGTSSGETSNTFIWEKSKHNLHKYSASYEFVSHIGAQEIHLNFDKTLTTNIETEGVVAKLPTLSTFDIKVPN